MILDCFPLPTRVGRPDDPSSARRNCVGAAAACGAGREVTGVCPLLTAPRRRCRIHQHRSHREWLQCGERVVWADVVCGVRADQRLGEHLGGHHRVHQRNVNCLRLRGSAPRSAVAVWPLPTITDGTCAPVISH